MCRTFTFYHLCGHVHHNHTISCPNPVPFTSSPPPCHSPSPPHPDTKIISPSPSCAIVVHEPHHYPTLCNSCKAVGMISEWFAKSPHARTEAIMEWRKREGSGPSRTRAASTSPANALDVLGLRDASNDLGVNDGEEKLEEMPLIQPKDLYSNSNREGESESEAWIQSNAEGWIRSASSASSATTVIRVDSPVSASSANTDPGSTPISPSTTRPLGKSRPSSSEEEAEAEAGDRSKWPQWLLEQSTSTTDLQNDATAPAPAPVANVSTSPRTAATTTTTTTTMTDLRRNANANQSARSRLPVPTAPAAKEKERRSLLPVPRAVSGVERRWHF